VVQANTEKRDHDREAEGLQGSYAIKSQQSLSSMALQPFEGSEIEKDDDIGSGPINPLTLFFFSTLAAVPDPLFDCLDNAEVEEQMPGIGGVAEEAGAIPKPSNAATGDGPELTPEEPADIMAAVQRKVW